MGLVELELGGRGVHVTPVLLLTLAVECLLQKQRKEHVPQSCTDLSHVTSTQYLLAITARASVTWYDGSSLPRIGRWAESTVGSIRGSQMGQKRESSSLSHLAALQGDGFSLAA